MVLLLIGFRWRLRVATSPRSDRNEQLVDLLAAFHFLGWKLRQCELVEFLIRIFWSGNCQKGIAFGRHFVAIDKQPQRFFGLDAKAFVSLKHIPIDHLLGGVDPYDDIDCSADGGISIAVVGRMGTLAMA